MDSDWNLTKTGTGNLTKTGTGTLTSTGTGNLTKTGTGNLTSTGIIMCSVNVFDLPVNVIRQVE